MKKKISFRTFFILWFLGAMVLMLLNGYTLQSSLLQSLIIASLGIILLIHPMWPESMEEYLDEPNCKKMIRMLSAIEIVVAFLIKTEF